MQHVDRSPAQKAAGATAAKILIEIAAVNFRPEEPYTLTAGWASPVYVDCRKLISYPRARRKVIDLAVEAVESEIGHASIDAVAGGETAGIPYAAWMAESMDIPMQYVRKKPKGFGRNAQIEGDLSEGQRILLVEDLATDGGSKINFVNALRTAGATVTDTFVVFFYGVFPGALKTLNDAGVNLHYLANWWDVLHVAEEGEYFSKKSIAGVKSFLEDPIAWSAAHGGRGAEGEG
ncbi:orotate phosphoribosyltransferase [Magnetospira sp. QH-2]|uniref:orotate phosphoribosyltransferase n=1 Tax=Magnetospira sp. (strain QH-2) TaxID=1288970 RepID=UPI0003E80CFF|nr:orotate phosphoribosyltransferase [Magnetospira sp. QH-2]CCQ73256.1 Orotate phosphoribosyltransferase [Magnetospira sp. QH-2]